MENEIVGEVVNEMAEPIIGEVVKSGLTKGGKITMLVGGGALVGGLIVASVSLYKRYKKRKAAKEAAAEVAMPGNEPSTDNSSDSETPEKNDETKKGKEKH